MSLALPSRPRAVRIVGWPPAAPCCAAALADGEQPASAAPWVADLDRFVRDEPARAGTVLTQWLSPRGPHQNGPHRGVACDGCQ